MTSQSPDTPTPPAWLVEWIRDAECHSQWHSLVLGASCGADLHRISCHVANYLNEFDGEAGCQWRAFDIEELRHLAGDPVTRDLLLSGAETESPSSLSTPADSDFERIVRRLACLGGVILEGQCGLDAATDLKEAFHICLCTANPDTSANYHMWINPNRFSRDSLVSVIADSFLNWSSQRGTISRRSSEDSAGHRPGDEPPSMEFAI